MALPRSRQVRWLSAAVIVFALSSTAAFLQPPKPDPYQSLRPDDLSWWLYPLENNAFQRAPQLSGFILALANPPGTERLWAVGSGGIVIRSEDAGGSWSQVSLPAHNEDLSDVFFFDADHGWVVGAAGTFFLTTDGGEIWQKPKSFPGDLDDLTDIHFTSLKNGWMVDADEGLFRTSDAGFTWQPYPIGDDDQTSWGRMYFTDAMNGWIIGDNAAASTVDGGKTWIQRTYPFKDFEFASDIFFLDARYGWILGDEGSVFATENGGSSWILRARTRDAQAFRIFFQDRKHGWLIGAGDAWSVLRTTDGGLSWTRERRLSDNYFAAIHFLDKRVGWIAGTSIIATTNGGRTWTRSLRSLGHALTAATWIDEKHAIAADFAGTILRTEDSGKNWRTVTSAPAALVTVYFLGLNGWAGGRRGVMLKTTNGGIDWNPQPINIRGDISDVDFLDAKYGWAVAGGQLFRTRDGGIFWEEIKSAPRLREVRFSSLSRGWGWGWMQDQKFSNLYFEPFFAVTTDGGLTWETSSPPIKQSPRDARRRIRYLSVPAGQLIDSKRGFLSSEAQLFFTSDSGASWQTRTYPARPGELQGFDFLAGARRGWAFDRTSQIYATTDAGITWKKLERLPRPLTKIQFASGTMGCALAVDGSIFITRNGGKTWENSREHKMHPAPWYFVSLLLVVGLTWTGLRHRQHSAEWTSVADVLASDRPVDASQHDVLNLDPLAQALSRFLRNESTQPPLTIAVTGEWGSGKSSLMNLLRDDLRRHGFHPVAFNAWHHQKEEHLLASLLESIRREAIPAPWARGGLRFRLRLLWIRGSRAWFVAFLVLFTIATYTGLFLADPSSLRARLTDLEQAASRLAPWFGGEKKEAGPVSIAPELTWLLGLGAVAETLRRGLRSFGIRPAQLLAGASGSLKLSALEQQLGFRSQFSREFNDVTRALHPRSMVILIDDLDRCRPENVTEILEAVNFLVSSGECVVVMGLDIDRVERAVGLAFRDVATEMLDLSSASPQNYIVIPGKDQDPRENSGEDPETEELKRQRQRFARQYLEKLINIEVPVPHPNAKEFAGLFEVLNDDEQPGRLAAFVLRAAGMVRRWSIASFVLTLLGLGFWIGFSSGGKTPQPKQVREIPKAEAIATPPPAPKIQEQQTPIPVEPSLPEEKPLVEARLYDAQPGKQSPWILSLPLLFVGLLMIWRVVQAQEDIVRDSPEFVDALRIWTPFLFSKRNNPRAAKRFLNRVRYYAMFQRTYSPPLSLLQKLLIRLKLLHGRKVLQPAEPIPEKILVALSAIQHCDREWLSDGNLYVDFGEYLRQEGAPLSLLEHLDEFRSWGSLERYRESFARISEGIRVT